MMLFSALPLLAQQKVASDLNRELVSSDYARNSISVVVVDRGDGYDRRVAKAVEAINFGDKFDKNIIPTTHVEVGTPRSERPNIDEVNSAIAQSNIGREVVTYWFTAGRGESMSGELIESRGRYAATDQDVLSASSVKIDDNALADIGYALINNSYVIAVDCSNFEQSKDVTGKPTESVLVTLCAYKIDFNEDKQNEFYERCWIDASTSEEERAMRREAFLEMSFPVTPLCSSWSIGVDYTDGGGQEGAIESAYEDAFEDLEAQIEAWHVKTSILQTRPLAAKIGTKEGLKSKDRYIAYQTVRRGEGADAVTYSQKRGYVRATNVANNSSVSDGQSKMSEFYQISDVRNIEMGYILEQSKDIAMGVALSYNTSPLSMANLTLDYLLGIKTSGISSYTIIDIGYDMITSSQLSDAGVSTSIMNLEDGLSYINIGVGYGVGLRASRSIEIVPSVIVGADYTEVNNEILDDDQSSGSTSAKIAYLCKAGAKVNINIAYPLQLVAGVDYSMLIAEGSDYALYNSHLDTGGLKRKGGLGLSFGVKYVF